MGAEGHTGGGLPGSVAHTVETLGSGHSLIWHPRSARYSPVESVQPPLAFLSSAEVRRWGVNLHQRNGKQVDGSMGSTVFRWG